MQAAGLHPGARPARRTSSPTPQDFEKGGEDRAYALYVLARNGRAPIGDLRYYADTRLDRFSTPLAQAQLGAALAMLGDKERAETAFAAALDSARRQATTRAIAPTTAPACATARRCVTLAAETGIAEPRRRSSPRVIAKAYASRSYTSTQEQAWMLLAARALDRGGASDTTLTVNGAAAHGRRSTAR